MNATSPEPYTSQTEALVDLEEWMGMLATEHIIVNFDAYGHEIGKNMYAYKPNGGKWQLYMFDLDWLMLAAVLHRSDYAPSTAPLFNADDPRIVRMYNHPPFLRAYYRAIKRAVDGPLVSANCDPVMDAKYRSLVANGISFCDGQALAAPSAVKNWFSQRHTALANQLNALQAPYSITSNGGADLTTSSDVVTLTGSAPIEVQSVQVNGQTYPVTWTTLTNWSLQLAVPPGQSTLALSGVDTAGHPLTNDTASLKVDLYRPGRVAPRPGRHQRNHVSSLGGQCRVRRALQSVDHFHFRSQLLAAPRRRLHLSRRQPARTGQLRRRGQGSGRFRRCLWQHHSGPGRILGQAVVQR